MNTNNYLEKYARDIEILQNERYQYIKICNQLALLKNRKKIIGRTKINIKYQKFDGNDKCPACMQLLNYSLKDIYGYYQKINDTISLEHKIKEEIKIEEDKLIKSKRKILDHESLIQERYNALSAISQGNISYDSWMDSKVNNKLYIKIDKDINNKKDELVLIKAKLNSFQDQDIETQRREKEENFKIIFEQYMKDMNIKIWRERRYNRLYEITSFPCQGVELHKTVMAYHFAFNYIISKNINIHRMPFLLDGILKEDIDKTSLDEIFSFIAKRLPSDTQTFISVSEHKLENREAKEGPLKSIDLVEINKKYFNGYAKNIYIGEGINQRCFLSSNLDQYSNLLRNTLSIVYNN